jgi:prostaglandin-E synthase
MFSNYNYNKSVPFIYWAQSNELIFIKLELSDIDDKNVNINSDSISAQFLSKQKETIYEFKLNLYSDINNEESKYLYNDRCINIILKKTETGYWDRLAKDKNELKMHIKVNWDLWQDEDEEGVNENVPNMDYESMMQQMMGGGMGGGMGGMDINAMMEQMKGMQGMDDGEGEEDGEDGEDGDEGDEGEEDGEDGEEEGGEEDEDYNEKYFNSKINIIDTENETELIDHIPSNEEVESNA